MSMLLIPAGVWQRMVEIDHNLTFNDFVALALTSKAHYKAVRGGIKWEVIYKKWGVEGGRPLVCPDNTDPRLHAWKRMVELAKIGDCAVCWRASFRSRVPRVPRSWLKHCNAKQHRCLDCFLRLYNTTRYPGPEPLSLWDRCTRIEVPLGYEGAPDIAYPSAIDVHAHVAIHHVDQGQHVLRYFQPQLDAYYEAWVDHTLQTLGWKPGLACVRQGALKYLRERTSTTNMTPEDLLKWIRWMAPIVYMQTQSTHHETEAEKELREMDTGE